MLGGRAPKKWEATPHWLAQGQLPPHSLVIIGSHI